MDKQKTQYEELCGISRKHKIAVVREHGTEKEGVASLIQFGKVAAFFGNDDGSDDCIITAEAFNRRFEIIGEENE